jgi:hypothetical protein
MAGNGRRTSNLIRDMRFPSIALVAVLLASTAAPASHGTETRDYLGGSGDVSVLLCSERPSLGGACFQTPSGHLTAKIRVIDDSGLPVGGAYRFEAADGSSLTRGSFCQSVNAPIPSTAKTLTVFVSSLRSPMDCPVVNGMVPGAATKGVVTVTWLTLAATGSGTTGSPLVVGSTSGIAGSATFAGACLTLAGAISRDAGRQRWLGAYWPEHPPTSTACDEERPHVDLTILCVETVGPQFFAHAKGTDNKTYLVRVWDGGLDDTDHVGVVRDVPDAYRCGASAVPVIPITEGAFVVASST